MKKQNIFIDFDGTICFDYFWRSAPFEINKKITSYLFQENIPLIEQWMKGVVSSEEITSKIAQAIKLDYEVIWDIFVKDCKDMFVDPKILNQVIKCNKNNNTILITDNMDCFNRFTKPKLELDKYFSNIYNSSDYGILKDESFKNNLFTNVIAENNYDISKSVLIDNSQKNCDIFKSLGGNSFLVKTKEDTISILKMLE